MTMLLTLFESVLTPLLAMSLTAAFVAVVVLLLRLILKRRAPRQVICLLWLVVFARLLIPAAVESPFSLVPSRLDDLVSQQSEPAEEPSAPLPTPSVQTPVPTPSVQTPVLTPPVQTPVTSAPTPPQAPAVTEEPAVPVWRYAAPALWLAGVAAMLIYGVLSYFSLRRRVFDAIAAGDGVWEHPALASPFILGLFRPKIYLPMGLDGQARQFILHHERAHLRRRDHIVKPICWLALAIHWFNPLAWAAFLLMSRDIEAACDESVIRRLGSEVKANYSATLLALAARRRFPAPSPLSFGEGDARARIKNVLNFKKPALWVTIIAILVVIAAAVCLLTDPMTPDGPDLEGYTTRSEYPGLYFLEEESSTVGDKITAYKLEDGELVLVGGYDEHLANNFTGLIGPDGIEQPLLAAPDEVYAMFEELLAAACLELDPNWTPPGERGENNDPVVDPAPISAPDELFPAALNDQVKIVVPGLGMTDVLSVLVRETAPGVDMQITQMAAVDLDGDGIAEVLLRLETPGMDYGTMILHYNGSDGQVYGYVLWFRAFNSVKTDGTFTYSSGASVNGIARISFTSEGYEQEKITYSEWNHPDPNVYCYVNKQPATEEEFLDAFAAWRETPNLTWTEYTAENLKAFISQHFADDGPPSALGVLGSLPGELVTPDTLPDDPEEYYLVSELPEERIYLYARNRGQDSMLVWENFSWPLEGRAAHTPRMNLPEMTMLNDNTVAVVSQVGSGTGVGVKELAVYELVEDNVVGSSHYTGMRDYVYDWRTIASQFNQNNTLVYDADTNSLALTYSGVTYCTDSLAEDLAQAYGLEDGFTGALAATGAIVRYQANADGTFTVTMETAIAKGGQGNFDEDGFWSGADEDSHYYPMSIGATGLALTWNIVFRDGGFRTYPLSISVSGAASTDRTVQLNLPTRTQRLAAATKDFYVIRDDGTLIMWGSPESVFDGSDLSSVPLEAPLELMEDVVFVEVGFYGGIMVIDQNGTLWGLGLRANPESPNTPRRLMDDVAMVSCGQFDDLILKKDGTLWIRERNSSTLPTLDVQEVNGETYYKLMDHVVRAGAGGLGCGSVTLADGTHWAWTYQVDGLVEVPDSSLSEVMLYGIRFDHVAEHAVGEFEAILLMEDGSLWSLKPDGALTDISFVLQ